VLIIFLSLSRLWKWSAGTECWPRFQWHRSSKIYSEVLCSEERVTQCKDKSSACSLECSKRMGKVGSCYGLFTDTCLVFVLLLCVQLCLATLWMPMKWVFALAYAVRWKLTLLPPVCRNSMLRVDAKQSAPKDGRSPLEFFEVSC
jgi:hypothetical protein